MRAAQYHYRVRSRRLAGFTLIEMMVALAIGALVVASVFTLGGASARHFQEQQRIGVTQRSVRMAMNRLRRDVARAGYLGVSSTLAPNAGVCNAPSAGRTVAGVWMSNDDPAGNSVLSALNRTTNGVSADRLRLVGNYATSDEYQVRAGPAGQPNQIRLATQTQAFLSSFVASTGGGAGTRDEDRFTSVFRPGRLLRIQAMTGEVAIVRISTSRWTGDDAVIIFSPSISDSMRCASGPVGIGGSMVAPLSEIEYFIDSPEASSALNPTSTAVVGAPTQLVRHELNMLDGSEIVGTRRVVLEFAVDFNVSFVHDANLTPGLPPNLRRVDGAAAQNISQNRPWEIRSAILSIAARTPEQDRRFPWTYGAGRPATAPLNRFLVIPGQPGAARVRQLTTEVQIQNMVPRAL